jgi:hypothetical protein
MSNYLFSCVLQPEAKAVGDKTLISFVSAQNEPRQAVAGSKATVFWHGLDSPYSLEDRRTTPCRHQTNISIPLPSWKPTTNLDSASLQDK